MRVVLSNTFSKSCDSLDLGPITSSSKRQPHNNVSCYVLFYVQILGSTSRFSRVIMFKGNHNFKNKSVS